MGKTEIFRAINMTALTIPAGTAVIAPGFRYGDMLELMGQKDQGCIIADPLHSGKYDPKPCKVVGHWANK